MAAVGLVCGIGGVVAGGYMGDALTRAAPRRPRPRDRPVVAGGRTVRRRSLLVTHQATFMVLTAVGVFLLSVYNGPRPP